VGGGRGYAVDPALPNRYLNIQREIRQLKEEFPDVNLSSDVVNVHRQQ